VAIGQAEAQASRHSPARTEQLRGHLAMLLFSGLIAGSFSLGGQVANEIAPAALNTVRFAIATVIIGVLARSTGVLTAAAARAPWRYLILGVLFAFYFVTMFEGLKTAPPVSAAAVFTLAPGVSALVGWLLLRQIITPRMALALVVGCAGALWVIFRADISALLSFHVGTGEVIFFWGVVAHGIYAPVSRRLNRGEHPLTFTFGMLLAGFAVLAIYGWADIRATDWTTLPWLVWITIAYTSILAGSTTFVLLQYAVMRIPSSKVMAYTYLTPSWVILWEIAFGHGVPPVAVLAGVGLTIVALLLLLKDETG
jgi:drug/metabolite transporter (DMT)-like permease